MSENTGMNTPAPSFARRHWMLGVGALAATAGAGLAWWRLQPDDVPMQDVQAFWEKRFEQLDGTVLHMASLRGRPLLLNFWATWCPPCVQELPMIEAFGRQHASNGVQVLALAIDRPAAVRAFLERQGLSIPVALAGAEGTGLAKSLGNLNGGLPFSVFFRANASIYRQKLGQLVQADLDNWLSLGL
jgi:thiol-disulfide isomerase/thioredoxin